MLTSNAVLMIDNILDWLAIKVYKPPILEEIGENITQMAEVDSTVTDASNISAVPAVEEEG